MSLRTQVYLRLLLSLQDSPATIEQLARHPRWQAYGEHEAIRTIQQALPDVRQAVTGPDAQGRYTLAPTVAAQLAAVLARNQGDRT